MRKDILEIRRQIFHALALIAVPVIAFLDTAVLIKIGILFCLLTLGLYWYFDLRKQRRQKVQKWMKGVFDDETRKFIQENTSFIDDIEEFIVDKLFKQLVRRREQGPFLNVFAVFMSLTSVIILFGKEIAAVCVIALALGDSVSTIFGKFFGKHKLFYNKSKSWEGSIAFVLFTMLGIWLMYQLFPALIIVGMPIGFVIVFSGIAGAIIESLDIINDNYMIPLTLGTLLFILSFFF
jgi:dolichol kinase